MVFLASLGAPLSGTGITMVSRGWLVLEHVVVAAVLILMLSRTAGNG